MRLFTLLTAGVILASCPMAWAADDSYTMQFTKPSQDVALSFAKQGVVGKVLVEEGDQVKKGQVLVQLEDAAEAANLEQLKAQAQSDIRVRAAEKERDQKVLDLKKYQRAFDNKAATELEVQHAALDVKIADLTYDLAKFEHEQDQRKYVEAKLQLERMRILAPFDGRVQKISKRVGEAVDVRDEVMRLVKIDPLWVDVPVPESQVAGIKMGQACRVIFPAPASGPSTRPGDAGGNAVEAKVILLSAVSDAGSRTLTVRVEVPNPSNRHAGEYVNIDFREDASVAKK